MISSREAVWLIARREILARGRDKATLVSTAITVMIVAAIVWLPSLFGGTDTVRVAVTDAGIPVGELADHAGQPFDAEFVVIRVDSDAEVRQLVASGDVDAGLLGANRIIASGNAPDSAVPALQAASQLERQSAPQPAPLQVITVDEDAQDRKGFATVALILLYGQLLGYGIWVANGVVEEKTSRIVEILLATIRPRELLTGKVLGIGLVGLVQLLIIAAAGILMATVSDRVDVGTREIGALPIVLAWFVGGYALYACAFALVGATVTRQEDVQTAATPLIMAVLASFFLSFQAIEDPASSMSQLLSFVPFSAPLVMPVRMIVGDVAAWEVLLSAALLLAAIALAITVAGRLYGRAVLQTGGRVRLRTLLRSG